MVRSMMDSRSLSSVVQDLHRMMGSADPSARSQAWAALQHLGFTE